MLIFYISHFKLNLILPTNILAKLNFNHLKIGFGDDCVLASAGEIYCVACFNISFLPVDYGFALSVSYNPHFVTMILTVIIH